MRRGELLGLRWADVDLNEGRIAIRHTLVMADGKPAMAEPKTAKGRRSLTLAPEVLDTLRAHRAQQAAERLSWGVDYTDSGLVITTRGRPAPAPRDALGPVRPPRQASRTPTDPTA
jgi:integrase